MKKIIMGGAAVLLALGGVSVSAVTAQGHNLELKGEATCVSGVVSVTWTGDTSNVPDNDADGVVTVKSHTPPSSTLDKDTVNVTGNSSFTIVQSDIAGDFKGNVNINVDIAWPHFTQNDVTGHVKLDGDCTPPPPVDVCKNLDGNQATIPTGLIDDGNGNCITPPIDVCANIDGIQTTVPDGLVKDGDNCVEPPKPVVEQCTAFGPTTYTAIAPADDQGTSNLPPTINTSDTRLNGHNQITGNALHTYTDGNSDVVGGVNQDKAAVYFSTPGLTLGKVGTPAFEYSAASGTKPGFQIVLSNGRILVGESDYYGNRFWSKTAQAGVPAADGYPASADLNTWFQALGDMAIPYEGSSVGSGVKGDVTITKITNGNGCDILFKDFVKPTLPETKVEYGSWIDSTYKCGDTTKSQTRTVSTTTYAYDDKFNVVPTTTNTSETQNVALTDAEIAALNCPVVTTQNPPTKQVVNQQLPNVLASTNGSFDTNWILYGILMIGGGAILAFFAWLISGTVKSRRDAGEQ